MLVSLPNDVDFDRWLANYEAGIETPSASAPSQPKGKPMKREDFISQFNVEVE